MYVYKYSLRKYLKKIKLYEILKNICEKVINNQVRHNSCLNKISKLCI